MEDVLINPSHESSTAEQPPSEMIDVKPKYDSYEIEEYWLARDAEVVLCGTVVARNEQIVTLSGDADNDVPPMLFAGISDDLRARFRRHANGAVLLLVALLACGSTYFAVANYPEVSFGSNLALLIGIPIALIIAVALMRRRWNL